MALILFERQKFVVFLAFCLTKIHWVVPEIQFFVTISPVNIFECYSFYFLSNFPGLNIKSFRDLVK